MKRQARLAVIAALCAGTTLAPAQGVVKDAHYGDTLFHFFQDRHFDAITGLMVSQHFERVPNHADEAEVLRGGMLLSYGLHREAGEVFARLIDRNAAPAVRDRAWYFVAKIRHQRGLVAEAEEALARVANPLPGELEDERQLLRAQLRMAQGDDAAAVRVLDAIKTSPTAGQVARFNLGVALVRSGEAERGRTLLDEVGRAPARDEEQRSLRDRANVALGFSALQERQPEQARAVLQRVRLTGAQSNKALLGFGWAAAELKAPKDALVPWTELAGRDAADAAVLEAKIALPYAYAELGALGQALRGYEDALTLYEAEAKRLDESIAAIRGGALVGALLEKNPSATMGAFGGAIRELPAAPHAAHLSQLMAGHEFQEAFKNLRDLQFLERNLAEWTGRLGVFGDMLANRRQGFAERLPKVLQRAGASELPALRQRRDELAAEVARAESANDGLGFADARQLALLERLARVHEALARSDNPEQAENARRQLGPLTWELALLERLARVREALAQGEDRELAERARRVLGALTWELAREAPARAWEAKKALRETDRALAEAAQHEAALQRAQQDEPARFERFAERIAGLAARLQAASPRVAALGREQQGRLQDLAVAELERQKERLDVYGAQARLAIAQLHDRAQVADAKR